MRSQHFRDENQEIRARFRVKTFFKDKYSADLELKSLPTPALYILLFNFKHAACFLQRIFTVLLIVHTITHTKFLEDLCL